MRAPMEASAVVELLRVTPCGRRLLDAASGGWVWLRGRRGAGHDAGDARGSSMLRSRATSAPLALALGARRVSTSGSVRRRSGPTGAASTWRARAPRRTPRRVRCPTSRGPPIDEDLARRDVTVTPSRSRLPTARCRPGPGRSTTCGTASCGCCTSARSPTTRRRVWRVARYAARLGFAVEPHGRARRRRRGPASVSGERLRQRAAPRRSPRTTRARCSSARGAQRPRLPEGFVPRPGRTVDRPSSCSRPTGAGPHGPRRLLRGHGRRAARARLDHLQFHGRRPRRRRRRVALGHRRAAARGRAERDRPRRARGARRGRRARRRATTPAPGSTSCATSAPRDQRRGPARRRGAATGPGGRRAPAGRSTRAWTASPSGTGRASSRSRSISSVRPLCPRLVARRALPSSLPPPPPPDGRRRIGG